MPVYPQTLKQWNVYPSAGGVAIGVADLTLPRLQMEKDPTKGAGIGGSLNLPVIGNVQPMQCTIAWHVNSLQSFSLFKGNGQQIRCLSSILNVDTQSGVFNELPEEVVMTCFASEYDLGKREASTKAVITQIYDVTYLAVWFAGKPMWIIDPFNDICIIQGEDLNAQTRANVG
jgi:P2 family phage contractile tail tube protein